MSYRMTELTNTVRVGKRSDGSLDLEIWRTPRGWRPEAQTEEEPEQTFIPADALEELFEFLR